MPTLDRVSNSRGQKNTKNIYINTYILNYFKFESPPLRIIQYKMK